jgi:3-methyl-2-oxobutanoate hydroxymethyltransferase
MNQRTAKDIRALKSKEKIAMLTAYDYPTAVILDEAGIDILLVGDSLGNVILGFPNTLRVTLDMMIHHTQAVVRGVKKALVVADLPFGSYQASPSQAIENASRLLSEGHAHAVKLEGGKIMAETVRRLVEVGIPVMGHIGLTPQSINELGGYFTHGKTSPEAMSLMEDALALEKAGAFSVVLECVEPELSKHITQNIGIPTIGIGSGNDCDGQVLVTHDMIGFTTQKVPKFVQQTANLRTIITESTLSYITRVKENQK